MTTGRIVSNLCTVFSSEGTSEISQLRSGWCLAKKNIQVPQGRRTFSAVLSGLNFLRIFFQPLRSWLISGCRSATPFAAAALVLFFAAGAMAATTNTLSDAEIQGRTLAQKIFELQPAENFTNTGVVKVKDGAGKKFEIRFEMRIKAELTNSFITYETVATNASDSHEELSVCHPNNNKYSCGYGGNQFAKLESFANSDFSAYDLAMDFIYWPQQKVLKKEVHRSCGCTVLESTNPNPSTKGYSRVVSWIDNDSLGIVEAYAYDVNGKKLKNFYPKNLKKVNGQYQVQTMIMKNLQTGSTTRLEFDLKKSE